MPPAIGGLLIAAGASFASGAIMAGITTGAILAGINYGGAALDEPEAG